MASTVATKRDFVRQEAAVDGGLIQPLLSVAKSVRQLVGLKLAAVEVMVGQDQFLLLFADGAPRSVLEIADALSVRASTVSKMTDILERKGWVTRWPDSQDARRVLLRLTEAGQAAADRVRVVEAALEAELMDGLGHDHHLLAPLAHLDRVLTKRLRRLR